MANSNFDLSTAMDSVYRLTDPDRLDKADAIDFVDEFINELEVYKETLEEELAAESDADENEEEEPEDE